MLQHARHAAPLPPAAHVPAATRATALRVRQDPIPAGQPFGAIDQTLADSFPASDPPSWTHGIARVATEGAPDEPGAAWGSRYLEAVAPDEPRVQPARVSPPGSRIGFWRGVRSVLGAMGLVLLVPFVVLLLGLPIALLVRLLVDAVSLAMSFSGAR